MIETLASFWMVHKDLKRREIFHFLVNLEKHQGSSFMKVNPGCVKVFSTSFKTKVLKLQCMGKLALGSLFKKNRLPVPCLIRIVKDGAGHSAL